MNPIYSECFPLLFTSNSITCTGKKERKWREREREREREGEREREKVWERGDNSKNCVLLLDLGKKCGEDKGLLQN